jgi:Ser/Thr protein kinase RdoA (MazF antagonist)
MNLDGPARDLLAHYPGSLAGEVAIPLGNHGGFSGARIWRLPQSNLCLRAWPVPFEPIWLTRIHYLMRHAREAGLDFVPRALGTREGQTWVQHAARLWDLTTWMPGAADFHRQPSREKLRSVCVALARLHECWAKVASLPGPVLAIRWRRQLVQDWQNLIAGGWRPAFVEGCVDPVQPWAERAWALVLPLIDRMPAQLAPWDGEVVTLHPCLCDVWHDHVLFRGDAVSGIVDYGSVKTDHPAVDLARLLGSLVGDDAEWWAEGLKSYGEVRPLSEWEQALARVLDQTGTILAAANWLRWLYREDRQYEDRQAVARRLAAIVERLVRIKD